MRPTRRRFLRDAAGICVALPALASLRPAYAGGEAEAPRRFVVFWETGGTLNNRGTAEHHAATHPWNDWRPQGPADDPRLGPIHADLEPHRAQLLFLSGLDNFAQPGEHGLADVGSLTARAPILTAHGTVEAAGPSIDQLLAARLTSRWPAPFSSVDLVVPGPHYGEPSHRAAGQPVAREADPRAAFERLFANLDAGLPAEALARVRAQRRSVLDGVRSGFRALAGRVSAADRHILEAHQEHLRAIERRLAVLDDPAIAAACAPPDLGPMAGRPRSADWAAVWPGFREVVAPLLVDIMVQALVCGLTHVATLHYPDTIEPFLPLPFQAISPQPDGHAMGHVARELGDPDGERARAWRAEMTANRRFKAGLVGRLLEGLAPFADGAGPLLERSLVLHLSEFSNAAQHTARDLPVMLAGGLVRGGRHLTLSEGGRGASVESHVDYRTEWSTHNLFTSVLNAFGFDDLHFGDEAAPRRGPLPGLD